MLEEHSIKELKANLRGGVIEPHDKAYDDARKVYNAMIHKKPRLITRCADVADIIHSVNKATYGDNYERLVAIKNKYDPTNLFRVNQNIKPATKKSEAVVSA